MSKALRGWFGAAHPYPLAMVLVLTALVGFASATGDLDGGRLLILLLAMLFSQLAIGWSNDYLDRDADARYQPSKPLPSGLIDADAMPWAIGAAVVMSVAFGLLLGVVPLALLVAGTMCGLAYNLGVKATRFSALPFILAFAVLPAYVWTALDVYRDAYLSLYAVGAPLAVSAHIANVLPDLETDRQQGRRTLAVVLGRRTSVAILLACLASPFAGSLAAVLLFDDPFSREALGTAPIVPALVVYGMLVAPAVFIYLSNQSRPALLIAFRLVVLASVLFAGAWLASV